MKRRKKVNILSLGCSKNLVDSERLMRMLDNVGFDVVHNDDYSSGSDVVIINTCGFISDAKEESVIEILKAIKAKEEGLTKEVIVMGCLSERYKTDLPTEIPKVCLL